MVVNIVETTFFQPGRSVAVTFQILDFTFYEMPIGERSKFSCLKIDDDTSSSDEGAVNGTKMMKTTPSQVSYCL